MSEREVKVKVSSLTLVAKQANTAFDIPVGRRCEIKGERQRWGG